MSCHRLRARLSALVLTTGLLAACTQAPQTGQQTSPTTAPTASSTPSSTTPLGDGATSPADSSSASGVTKVTVNYAGNGQPTHDLDLYRGDSDHPRPVVVWVHGGGWLGGDKIDLARAPMKQAADAFLGHGWAVASVNYRLSTQSRFPAQLQDVRSAIAYLAQHATDLGLDASRMAVAGESAGGQLALLAGMSRAASQGTGKLRAVVSYYGVTDLARVRSDRAAVPGCSAGEAGPTSPEGRLLGFDPEGRGGLALVKQASPVNQVHAAQLPILLIQGRQDCIVGVGQAQRLQAAIQGAGGSSQLLLLDGGHGDAAIYSPQALAPVVTFLEQHLG